MKKLGIFLLAATCLAGSALAQDTQKTQLANDVIKSMNADKMFDSMTGQIKQMVSAQTSMYLPADATPEQKAKIAKVQDQAVDLALEAAKGMVAKMGAIYAEVYSVEELTAMKAFFTSPEGKSMQAKQPQIMQKMMPLVQQMQAELMPKIGALVEQAKPAPAAAVTATTPPVSVTTEPVSVPAPAKAPAK
jgi:hypothetical protein